MFQLPECPSVLRIELAYCIGNVFIHAKFEQIKYFIEAGSLTLLVQAMSEQDDELVKVAVTAVKKVLRKTKRH